MIYVSTNPLSFQSCTCPSDTCISMVVSVLLFLNTAAQVFSTFGKPTRGGGGGGGGEGAYSTNIWRYTPRWFSTVISYPTCTRGAIVNSTLTKLCMRVHLNKEPIGFCWTDNDKIHSCSQSCDPFGHRHAAPSYVFFFSLGESFFTFLRHSNTPII